MPGANVPDLHFAGQVISGPASAARCQGLAIRAEGDGTDFPARAQEGDELSSRRDIPELHLPVVRAGSNELAVRREYHRPNGTSVPRQRGQLFFAGSVPELQDTVV